MKDRSFLALVVSGSAGNIREFSDLLAMFIRCVKTIVEKMTR